MQAQLGGRDRQTASDELQYGHSSGGRVGGSGTSNHSDAGSLQYAGGSRSVERVVSSVGGGGGGRSGTSSGGGSGSEHMSATQSRMARATDVETELMMIKEQQRQLEQKKMLLMKKQRELDLDAVAGSSGLPMG